MFFETLGVIYFLYMMPNPVQVCAIIFFIFYIKEDYDI